MKGQTVLEHRLAGVDTLLGGVNVSDRTCLHKGCSFPPACRGYCSAHYMQNRRHGYTWELGLPRAKPLLPRVEASSAQDGDCLTFQGTLNNSGYGQINYRGKRWLVHRAVWTELRGDIPAGLTIDHLCRNRRCVNVEHMEIVTRGENSRRGGGLDVAQANYAARTHCKWGHEYGPTRPRCLECNRVQWWRWAIRSGKYPASSLPAKYHASFIARYGALPCDPPSPLKETA